MDGKTFGLSPSGLNLMKECPRCFWLEKHNVWTRPNGIFPSLPNGMDRVLKIHFDKFMERGEMPPELCNNSHCENLKLFSDKELLNIWRNNKKGIEFSDEAGNILKGAVDNLLTHGKKLIVLDFKTRGFPLKENTHERYEDQINIYNFLLRKNGFETEDYGFLLFYFPDKVLETGEVVFETELKKMKVDIESAEVLWKRALRVLNSECPNAGCAWCERF